MDLPSDIIFDILFELTKYQKSLEGLISLVCKSFNKLIKNEIKNKWNLLLKSKINILVTIKYFLDNYTDIDYLSGPIMISNFNYNNEGLQNIKKYLRKKVYFIDKNQDHCLLDTVILTNIKMQTQFAPNIIGINEAYQDLIGVYRDDNNNIEYNRNYSNADELKTEDFWIYIFEELCHYCKTYSYIILPYFDNRILKYDGALLYDVIHIPVNKITEIT